MDDFRERYLPAKLEYYRQAAAAAETPRARHEYAWELIAQRKFAEAIEQEQKVLAARPKFNDAYFNIALCLEKLGDFRGAISNYFNELRVDPREDRAALALGRVYYKLNQHTQALAFLHHAIRENDQFENHLYLSQVLEALGRTAEAEEELQRSLKFGLKPGPKPAVKSDRSRP